MTLFLILSVIASKHAIASYYVEIEVNFATQGF